MIIYTNAPSDYDYAYVTELDPDVGRFTSGMDQDKPVRKLDINGPDWRIRHQRDRYSSGLYPSLDLAQFEEWVEAGYLVLNPPADENSDEAPAEPTPSPDLDAKCSQCGVSAGINDVGTTCRLCGRGVITIMSITVASEPDEEDESDYAAGLEPGSWCEDS